MNVANRQACAEQHYDYPIEDVFDAWLDPTSLADWMRVPSWEKGVTAESQPEVGGSYRLVMHKPDGDVVHTGTYLEIERPHRLVFYMDAPRFVGRGQCRHDRTLGPRWRDPSDPHS